VSTKTTLLDIVSLLALVTLALTSRFLLISHEMRSPLHGILAAIEFLEETSHSDFQTAMLETIKSCGRTLLDTINQILDFNKTATMKKAGRRDELAENKRGRAKAGENSMVGRLDICLTEDVALLIEEVVDAVTIGHLFAFRSPFGEYHVQA
jgi:signal transduction histidine kinase